MFLIAVGGSCAAQSIAVPRITAYSTAETGTDAIAWTPVQGPDGVLHFGVDGLLSFDGAAWQVSPMGGGSTARALAFGNDDRIWTAAKSNLGWFSRDATPRWQFHSLRERLPFPIEELGDGWHVFAEPAGALFVTESKILRWDGRDFQVWAMEAGRRLHAFEVEGKIYVQHPPTGLYVMEPDGPRLSIPAADLGTQAIFWLERWKDGWFFVSSQGLFTLSRGGKAEPFGAEGTAFLQREVLTAAARLPDGDLALGSFSGGIALLRPDGSVRRILSPADGLPTLNVYSLFADREGSLWATSPSRILRIPSAQPTRFFDERSGLPAQPIGKIVRHRGRIVVAGETGLLETDPTERTFHRTTVVRERVREVRSTPEGLLVTRNYAVELHDGDTIKRILATPTAATVAQPSRTVPGTTLIALQKEIISVDAAGAARVVVKNLPETANSIVEDARGQLWIGTLSTGVFTARPQSTEPVQATPLTLTAGTSVLAGATRVAATRSGDVLVFSSHGAWLLKEDTQQLQPVENYPARRIDSFSAGAAENELWILHSGDDRLAATAARISVDRHRAVWEPHSVQDLWGIGTPQSIFSENDGAGGTTLWIGGTAGLLRHEVSRELVSPRPLAPVLRAYAQGTDSGAFRSIEGALPYSTQAVRFEFSAPQFFLRPALRLQTFIEGIDRDWVPAAAGASRELTAVRDGKYAFRVRTVAETGVASEAATFSFQVLPPWWRTAPAIAGILLSLAPGFYAVSRLRLRSLRRRNRELEEKILQRTAQLAKASAAKTEFVANMSHDIRNPLNGIVGLSLALDDTRLDSRQREIVATLRECSMYLSSLVDDVLDFARIEAGQVELKPGPFAPAELLRSVATTLEGEAAEHGATLLVEVDPRLPPMLVGDAGRIQQILVNYAGNALKYAGGTIRLAAKSSADSRDELEFAVMDRGPGITPADQATLFTKFNRLKNARGESVKGTGLGLAACRSLADIMGGSVGVESAPDAGSTFYLRLPLVVSTPMPASPRSDLPSATVLIVEDADYNAWAAAAVLNKLGLPSERVRTGAEALELFTRRRFDVVLLDRNLPDIDGIEVAKQIRLVEADRPRALLLAVTAYCTTEDRALCLASGMDAFVGKPLTPEKLRKVLATEGRRLLAAPSVQVPADVAIAPLDLTLLTYISDGTGHGVTEQIEKFTVTLTEAENSLEHASSARDFSALAASAHQILSQARMVSATALENAATDLETAARARDPVAFGALLDPTRREIRALREAMRRRRLATPVT